ncbi:MAG: UDP-N-acetylglucosamine 2-epimerase [Methanotrichaceae archaeon]|nr:UDP-N-acetylglucosamine 2-epimerase [Methanotrichaceae archaeon]
MRTIGVITVGRSDYSILLPLLKRIHSDPNLRLFLIVSGSHLSPEFGLTVKDIEKDGFPIAAKVDMLLSSDTPKSIAKSMGLGIIGFSEVFEDSHIDILCVLGDRFEMHSAVIAASPFLIPVAHIAGGSVTVGAIDDLFRHSITKMSHLHFVEMETYSRRLIQMGEEPWRVNITGAMALDNLRELKYLSLDELNKRFGISLDQPPLLVTFHPPTREYDKTEFYTSELLDALDKFELPIVFTYPNADTNGRIIIRLFEEFIDKHNNSWLIPNMGMQGYFSLINQSLAMVGNSSSGIIETPSFRLPVVNIGNRQMGRITPNNIITVGYSSEEISCGIAHAIEAEFKNQLNDLINPYGDGYASKRIIKVLKRIPIDNALLEKHFYDR